MARRSRVVLPGIPHHKNTAGGRPCGSENFIKEIERQTGKTLSPRKPGPKQTASRDRHQLALTGVFEPIED